MRASLLACGLLAFGTGLAPSAVAQDFSAPVLPGPSPSALAFLEHGLPPAAAEARLEAAATRWFGLPDLTTRAVAVVLGAGSARTALGFSQTGDPMLGWVSLGLGLGGAARRGGAALRAVARRDGVPVIIDSPLGAGIGAEAGGGAWVETPGHLVVWASAPQLWMRGVGPPLARPLEVGGALGAANVTVWLVHSGPVRSRGMTGNHAAGLGLGARAWRVWLEAKDRPVRGGLGITARVRAVVVAAAIESHPILGETVRLSVGLASHGMLP